MMTACASSDNAYFKSKQIENYVKHLMSLSDFLRLYRVERMLIHKVLHSKYALVNPDKITN